jgi:hypothetical protein
LTYCRRHPRPHDEEFAAAIALAATKTHVNVELAKEEQRE